MLHGSGGVVPIPLTTEASQLRIEDEDEAENPVIYRDFKASNILLDSVIELSSILAD